MRSSLRKTLSSRYLPVVQVTMLVLLCTSLASDQALASLSPPAEGYRNNFDGIVIKSVSTRYDRESDSFHVFGEVLNNNKEWSAANIVINMSFFHSSPDDNILLGKISGPPHIRSLNPGESSAFELVASGVSASFIADFSYYQVSATWDSVRETKPGFLKLRVDNIGLDPCGSFHIEGTITNYDRHSTNDITVSAAFYNEEEQVVATFHENFLESDGKLPPGKSYPFNIVIENSTLTRFAYYNLNVQSNNYSSFSRDVEDYGMADGPSLRNDDTNTPRLRVFSNSTSYSIGPNDIEIFGDIHFDDMSPGNLSVKDRLAHQSYVLIKIMTPSGIVVDRATAPVDLDGTFSRIVNFIALDDSEGKIYIIRAEYFGAMAENTFNVDYYDSFSSPDESEVNSGNGNKDSEHICVEATEAPNTH